MKHYRSFILYSLIFGMVGIFIPLHAAAYDPPHPDTYLTFTAGDMEAQKRVFYDDPRPAAETWGIKDIIPKDLWDHMTGDTKEMGDLTAKILGFRSPEIVGKIAPDIKPGKYTQQDVAGNPAFKELLHPMIYRQIMEEHPYHACNFTEFEIVPTSQYYMHHYPAKRTLEREGKTKLDDKGYILHDTWEGGLPFPRPSGPFKAQQVVYNYQYKPLEFEVNMRLISIVLGWDRKLRMDTRTHVLLQRLRLSGRSLPGPDETPWLDDRARQLGEKDIMTFIYYSPRDLYGLTASSTYVMDVEKRHLNFMYVPAMRRIRKMSTTDTQDALPGQDSCYDDLESFQQQLSPTLYPYEYKILQEREFLMFSPNNRGALTVNEESRKMLNTVLERRPMYVVELKQLDGNYIYSKRVLYIDAEFWANNYSVNYDQKGRLYRTYASRHVWHPQMGSLSYHQGLIMQHDFVDKHTTLQHLTMIPAFWSRKDVGMTKVLQKAK